MGFPMVFDKTTLNEDPFLFVLGPRGDFWEGQGIGQSGQKFVFFFLKSPLWAFQQCMPQPYLLKTQFWSFQGLGSIFRRGRKWMGQVIFSDFLKSPFIGFPTVYYTAHFLFTTHFLAFWDYFWVHQEVDGAGEHFLGLKRQKTLKKYF